MALPSEKWGETMRLTISMGSFLVALSLMCYLVILIMRTDCFQRAAAVGIDVLVIVVSLCAVGLVLAVAGIVLEAQPRWLPTLGLVLNGLLSAVYAILYAIGKFGPVGLKS